MATKLETAELKNEQLATQIASMQETAVLRDAEIAKLATELKSAKASSDSWYKKMDEAKAEVDQVHLLLDAMSNPPARKGPANDYGQAVAFNLMTRLAAWLATRGAA